MDGSGNVYVTGSHAGNGTGYDYVTIKYLPNGAVAPGWPQPYDGPVGGDDFAFALTIDGDGNVYVTGWSTGNWTVRGSATIKYLPRGPWPLAGATAQWPWKQLR